MSVINDIRRSIDAMRKYKNDHRMINSLDVYVSEDVMKEAKETGKMDKNIKGEYFLDSIKVTELKGYPKGYISVE